jgi:dTDP-glucose 4,6-dehydratase
MKFLVTGGAGFIGSNFVHYLLEKYPESEIVVLDKLTYAGRMENLQDVMNKIKFIKGDICDEKDVEKAAKGCNAIFNFAAETHVDKSIIESGVFVKTDVIGTHKLLEAARKHDIEKYVQISTDEVYGSIENGSFEEHDTLDPSSPYSASKGGADLLVNAYFKTYKLPTLITRSSNNFGPFQFPEKMIPVLIINAIQNRPLPIYGDGKNVRDWIYVADNCEGIDFVHSKGKFGEIYNIASGSEKMNLDVANFILKELKKSKTLIKFVADRLGHDRRYSLDTTKIKKLGWKPRTSFEVGLKKTISWYVKNNWWWKPLVKND